jgi:hypothetical protein
LERLGGFQDAGAQQHRQSIHCDIQRICDTPDEEDRRWFPDIAGKGDAGGCCAMPWLSIATKAASLSSSASG